MTRWRGLRIEYDGNSDDGRVWDVVTPETKDCAQGGDFEGDEKSFVEEEVPASHESPRIVDPGASETNETTRYRHHDCHFGGTVVYKRKHAAVYGIGEEDTGRSSLVQGSADRNE